MKSNTKVAKYISDHKVRLKAELFSKVVLASRKGKPLILYDSQRPPFRLPDGRKPNFYLIRGFPVVNLDDAMKEAADDIEEDMAVIRRIRKDNGITD